MARVLLVAVPAPVLPRDARLPAPPILRLRVVPVAHPIVPALRRLDANVLVEELLRGEIVHEVLRGHKASLLVCILEQDLVEPLDDRLHDLLEPKLHRAVLLLERPDILPELLIDLADHPIQPILHIGVRQLHLLAHLNRLIVQFLCRLDLNVELMDLRVGGTATLNLDVGLLVLHL